MINYDRTYVELLKQKKCNSNRENCKYGLLRVLLAFFLVILIVKLIF